jgi:hypothetical protein
MRVTMIGLGHAIGLVGLALGTAVAGPLEPPGLPSSSSTSSLEELYDRMGAGVVAATGQTSCFAADGTPIGCSGTRQDGDLRRGVSVAPRFKDNLDGTVRDNLTGLVWLQQADCFGTQNWSSALGLATTLASGACGLQDGSAAGDWRLPNVNELRSLVVFGRPTNDGQPPIADGHPFLGFPFNGAYWTSTTRLAQGAPGDIPGHAYVVSFSGVATVGDTAWSVTGTTHLWPVRDGF